MAPMVVAPAQGEMRLGPDDLSAQLKPAGDQIAADHIAVERPVPHISDIAGKQRIGLPPVGAVIVEHLALRELAGTDPMARSPSRVAHSRIPVSLVRASAQHVPFADAVFDTIVMTWTLCSIPNPIAALAETRRVLKPGGRLLFVEHGLSPEIRIARWQHRLTPYWKRVGGGCHLDRKVDDLIRAAGFQVDAVETGYMKGPKSWTFMFQGWATKQE